MAVRRIVGPVMLYNLAVADGDFYCIGEPRLQAVNFERMRVLASRVIGGIVVVSVFLFGAWGVNFGPIVEERWGRVVPAILLGGLAGLATSAAIQAVRQPERKTKAEESQRELDGTKRAHKTSRQESQARGSSGDRGLNFSQSNGDLSSFSADSSLLRIVLRGRPRDR